MPHYMLINYATPDTEAGKLPAPEVFEQMGALVGGLQEQGRLVAGDGFARSSEGTRLLYEPGQEPVRTDGPFTDYEHMPSGYLIITADTLDQAVEVAAREAGILDNVTIDVRPLSGDMIVGAAHVPGARRWVSYFRALDVSAEPVEPSPEMYEAMGKLVQQEIESGRMLATGGLAPSSEGKRIVASGGKQQVIDGPFAEAKELIGGFAVFQCDTLEEAIGDDDTFARMIGHCVIDLRRITEEADFAEALEPEKAGHAAR